MTTSVVTSWFGALLWRALRPAFPADFRSSAVFAEWHACCVNLFQRSPREAMSSTGHPDEGGTIMRGMLLAAIAMVAMAGSLEAGHKHKYGHGHGHNHHGHHQSGGVIVVPGFGFGGSYGGFYGSTSLYRPRVYHDTSHFDYHPTTVYRHRNHYHVQPGHYDWHQDGHWHR
jgi:hypothetical protein